MSSKNVALVTGANKGIGLEIARQLGQAGYTVVVGARSAAKAQAAAATLKSEGLDAQPLKLDVTNADDVNALPAFFENQFGRLDALVNNAGVNLDSGADVTADVLRRTYETNVIGPFAVTKALLPLLQRAPAGRIVNHSSILGSLTRVSSGMARAFMAPAYCSSKAALNMITVVMAHELAGTNVKINAAHPGWVKTAMGGPDAPLSVEEGAKTAVELATLPADGPSGGYFHLGKTIAW